MTKRKKLVKDLDKIFSLFIRARDKHCVLCGSKERLQCGHLFSRASYSTRWSEINCHCQCASCNMRHEYDFYPFQSWFVSRFGQKIYDDLYATYKQARKIKDYEIQLLIEEYKIKIKDLQ